MVSFLRGVFDVLIVLQATQATIAGTVRDEQTGEPLAGVVIGMPDLSRAVATDAEGRYELRDVPPGPQHLAIQYIGYAERTLHALVPRDGLLEINISLRPQPFLLERVDVRPTVTMRGSDDDGHGERWVSIAAVRNHPLLSEADGFQALAGGEVLSKPESPTGLHVRGGASDQTAYLLDGIPIMSPYHAGGIFSAWNPDALSRLDLHSAAPSASFPDALSGVVSGVTRPAGRRLRGQGSVSTTQARVTLDGPLGIRDAGWMLSVRSGFPGVLSPRAEKSYLRGETGDWLAKIETPLFGGRLSVLGYESSNEFDAASGVELTVPASPAVPRAMDAGPASAGIAAMELARNSFGWQSRSLGATWTREVGATTIRVRGWSAAGGADALWALASGSIADLTAQRRDEGLFGAIEHRGSGTTYAGVRLERSRTMYEVLSGDVGPTPDVDVKTPVASVFLEHARPLGHRVTIELGTAVAAGAGGVHPAPRAQLNWLPTDRILLSGSYARLHQFAQSLRNSESVVGNIFPVDLFVGAGAAGVPVARSDQGVIAAEFRPLAGWRFGLQAYTRVFEGLLLVAPVDGEPFSTGAFTTGSGTSRGFSVDAAVSGARIGALASWGWRRVRFAYDANEYIPEHGLAHNFEAGVVVFPTSTSSIRLGATGLLGRRTTPIPGAVEWESCNLLDQGCEFAGSPHYGTEPLGSATLPGYFRLDLGLRKHWHLTALGRDATIALFGTLTNVIGRGNTLAWAADPITGDRTGLEMRPRAPLVVGLDWRF